MRPRRGPATRTDEQCAAPSSGSRTIVAAQRGRKPMTELLPGQLLYIFGASILDAALLSWLALLWYRRSVSRLMREAPSDAVASSVERLDSSVPSRSAASPNEPGELTLAEEPLEAPPQHAAVLRPGMVRVVVA